MDDRRIFWGLEVSISGFFWVGKFWQIFFWVAWFNVSGNFFGYSKLMFLFFVLYHFMLSGNFYYGWEIRHEIFWGINFGPRIFWGFCLKPKGFFWVLIFAPIRSSLSLEIRSTPSGLELSWKGRWIFHTIYPKLIYIFLIGNCVGKSNEKHQTFLKP